MPSSTAVSIPFNDLGRVAGAGDELAEVVERVVLSGRYLLGEHTDGFEREFADYLGVAHAIGVASGTSALELALLALSDTPRGEVVTAANAGGYGTLAARRCNLRVRFADVDANDLMLTPRTLERALTPRTDIVIVTHLYGKLAHVAEIRELCHARGIRVLEDCAQAAGARADGRFAGSVGDAAAFSFYPTKNLGALGDGGAVTTNDDRLAARVRRLRQYGWGAKYEIAEDHGCNSRLHEIQAAVLRARLPGLEQANRRRREIAARYAAACASTPLQFVHRDGPDYVAHLAVVRTAKRAQLAAELAARGVGTAVHYPLPDHRQGVIGAPATTRLPVTEAACAEVISLPCFPELRDTEVARVCSALTDAAESLR